MNHSDGSAPENTSRTAGFWRRGIALLRSPALVYLGSAVLARIASILLFPLYTRVLTTEEYGELAVVNTIITTLAGTIALGSQAAVSRMYFDGEGGEAAARRAGSVARWTLVLGVGVAALLVPLIPLLSSPTSAWRSPLGLSCALIGALGMVLVSVPSNFFRASQQPYRAAAVDTLTFLAMLLPALIMVAGLKMGLRGAMMALGFSGATLTLGAGIAILRWPGATWQPALLGEVLRFSLPLVPHLFAAQVFNAGDRWVLAAFGATASLGTFTLAIQLTTPSQMVVAAWSETETARLGEALRSGGARGLAAALPRSFRIYATAAGVAGLGTIALLPVIYVTLGARFTGALWLIPALLVCSVIDVFYLPSNTVLSLTSRTRELPPITFASGLFGLGMSAIFIPLFGTWGVILARGITVGFRSALTTWRAYAALRDRGAPSEAGSTS